MNTGRSLSHWLAFHFHYHERQDHLLEHLLRPLVVSLLAQGEVDSFFFVRFHLGGPHVRLRVRLCGDRRALIGTIQSAAERFFSSSPSQARLSEEKVRTMTHDILRSDPSEGGDAIYPDNFLRLAPFRPELDRYGGPELFPASLAFFAISSCRVLCWLHHQGGDSASRLSFAFHLLASQALGFSKSCQDLLGFLRYPAPRWEAAPPVLVARGDQVFEQRKESYVSALRRRIKEILDGEPNPERRLAERLLERAFREVAVRRRVLSSHLHMTANRLGLRNGEEVYLARLLWRTATELADSEPTLWSRLEQSLAEQSVSANDHRSLEDLLPAVFEELGGIPTPDSVRQ